MRYPTAPTTRMTSESARSSRKLSLVSPFLTFILLQQALLGLPVVQGYDLVRDYSGSGFFDGWDFWGNSRDLTHAVLVLLADENGCSWIGAGDEAWVDRENAMGSGLALVNSNGHAVMRVDNQTNIEAGGRRNSVRITSRDTYDVSSLWITDVVHLPWGCSVWPSFWTMGNSLPNDGEIDIIEGVNLVRDNQMALHTLPGCSHASPVDETGHAGEQNCSQSPGCLVNEAKPNSFGSGFNNNGGGVWAAQFDVSGIWFWPRNEIPESILQSTSTGSIDISQWGTPSASYRAASCDIQRFFGAQKLVFDTTLCGSWAGLPEVYQQQCGDAGSTGRCYSDRIVGSGSGYQDAYWEINYVRAYTTPLPTPTGIPGEIPPVLPATPEIPSTAPGVSAVFTGGPTPLPVSVSPNAATHAGMDFGRTVIAISWWLGLIGVGMVIGFS